MGYREIMLQVLVISTIHFIVGGAKEWPVKQGRMDSEA
jgi:hypothetical protein